MTSDVPKSSAPGCKVPAEAQSDVQVGDRVAAGLRGFGPLGILAILVVFAGNLVIVPLIAILVLLWAQRSGTPLSEIGFVRPMSWARAVFVGLAFGIALKLLLKIIVMPLLIAHAAFDLTALAIIYWNLERIRSPSNNRLQWSMSRGLHAQLARQLLAPASSDVARAGTIPWNKTDV